MSFNGLVECEMLLCFSLSMDSIVACHWRVLNDREKGTELSFANGGFSQLENDRTLLT